MVFFDIGGVMYDDTVYARALNTALRTLGATFSDAEFDDVDPARADEDFANFRAEVEVCRAVAARFELDHLTHSERRDIDIDVRWVYVHMIEEYARHNGHADLIRERIDGSIGD